jgi:hypothetical protein
MRFALPLQVFPNAMAGSGSQLPDRVKKTIVEVKKRMYQVVQHTVPGYFPCSGILPTNIAKTARKLVAAVFAYHSFES